MTTRTGSPRTAGTSPTTTIHPLAGDSDNFWPDKSIPFGSVQFIRPTAAHPEIRLRFLRPRFVYGASRPARRGRPPTDRTCATSSTTPAAAAGWATRTPTRGSPCLARSTRWTRRAAAAVTWTTAATAWSASLRVRGQTLRPSAGSASVPRVRPGRAAGPQRGRRAEQALFGPECPGREARLEQAEEIVRRAFETVRLMTPRP